MKCSRSLKINLAKYEMGTISTDECDSHDECIASLREQVLWLIKQGVEVSPGVKLFVGIK